MIKQSRYASLLNCLDPTIRHSESHAATKIDKKNAKVQLTEAESGERRVIADYTFEQISEMTRELFDVLFPSMVLSFRFHGLAVLGVILLSVEYTELLLGIDNSAPIAS